MARLSISATRRSIHIAIILLGAASLDREALAAVPEVIGCPAAYDPDLALQPLGTGPLTLSAVYCLRSKPSAFPVSTPSLSPDGEAFFSLDSVEGLTLGEIALGSNLQRFDGRVRLIFSPAGKFQFTWSNNGRSVLGVKQDTATHGGWATGPLKPFSFSLDGQERRLPDLSSPNGPLDEIYWIGNAGLALAAFGTRGDYYRPEHADPNPAFALVNAETGTLLQSVDMHSLPNMPAKQLISALASHVDDSGHIQVLLAFASRHWLYWDQGKAPRPAPLPPLKANALFAMSPDGTAVLFSNSLSASGPICEFNDKCPKPIPSSGAMAELRDITTGELIWSVEGTATTIAPSNPPAISPDGRYALLSMAPRDRRWQSSVLLDMRSGKILQEFMNPWNSPCAVGFSSDSKRAWISGGSRIVVYDIQPK